MSKQNDARHRVDNLVRAVEIGYTVSPADLAELRRSGFTRLARRARSAARRSEART